MRVRMRRRPRSRPCEYTDGFGGWPYSGVYDAPAGGGGGGVSLRNKLGVILGQSNASGVANPALADGAATGAGLGVTNTLAAAQLAHHVAPSVANPPVFADVPAPAGTFRDLQPYDVAPNFGMGVELSMLRYLLDSGAVDATTHWGKFAVSGCPISNFLPGSGYPSAGPDLFSLLCTYLDGLIASTGKSLGIMVLIQGESDADTDAEAAAYQGRLTTLIAALRARYGSDFLFVISRLNEQQIGGMGGGITAARAHTVQAAQDAVAAASPGNTICLNTDRVPVNTGQREHYLADGYWTLGNLLGHGIANAIAPARNDNQGVGPGPYVQWIREPSTGSDTASSGAFTAYGPAGDRAGDLHFLVVGTSSCVCNNAQPALTTAAGFVRVAAPAASTLSTTTFVYTDVYMRVVDQATLDLNGGRMPDPVVSDTTNRKDALIFSVRGGQGLGATPVPHGNNANGTTVNATGITTTAPNSLVLFVQTGFSGAATSSATGWACSGLAGFAVRRDSYRPRAEFISVASGTKAAAGASGSLTGTRGANAVFATFALEILAA